MIWELGYHVLELVAAHEAHIVPGAVEEILILRHMAFFIFTKESVSKLLRVRIHGQASCMHAFRVNYFDYFKNTYSKINQKIF